MYNLISMQHCFLKKKCGKNKLHYCRFLSEKKQHSTTFKQWARIESIHTCMHVQCETLLNQWHRNLQRTKFGESQQNPKGVPDLTPTLNNCVFFLVLVLFFFKESLIKVARLSNNYPPDLPKTLPKIFFSAIYYIHLLIRAKY